jgi:tellurite resistance protein
MSGRVRFGSDFLVLALDLNARAGDPSRSPGWAAAMLFLVDWDFTFRELDEAGDVTRGLYANNQLDDVNTCIERVCKHLRGNTDASKRLVQHLSAIATLDGVLTEAEEFFLGEIRAKLDLKPSDFKSSWERGARISAALLGFSEAANSQE